MKPSDNSGPAETQTPAALLPCGEADSVANPTLQTVAAPANLLWAWQRVQRNRGAPGIDGVNIGAFDHDLDARLDIIARNIRSGRYRPSPLRAVERPKEDLSGSRTLHIPTVQDRAVLQAIAQVLTPVWEPHFSPSSFAYREGRSALDAVLLAQQRLETGQHWIVDLDIEKFFDNVGHIRLMQRLAQRVEDVGLLDLIADFLRCPVQSDRGLRPTRVGLAQGSPLSPLLANIVLDELDQEYASHGWSFVRYSDDCILLARSEAEAGARLEFTREFLADRLQLHLNPLKTRIVQPSEVGFLGFSYRLSRYGHVQRQITKNALAAFRRKITDLAQPKKGKPLEDTFLAVAEYFRGWTNYFSFTQDNVLLAARSYACDALRAAAWLHWATPPERYRQLVRLGLCEATAEKAAFTLDFPGPEDDPPVLRRLLPDSLFERYGLRIQRPLRRPLSAHPLAQVLGAAPAEGQSTQAQDPHSEQSKPRPAPSRLPAERERAAIFRYLGTRLRVRPPPIWPPFPS